MINNFLIYLIECTACTMSFAGCYFVWLKRMTHFEWNRWYLISSLLLSVTIPLITIPKMSLLNDDTRQQFVAENLKLISNSFELKNGIFNPSILSGNSNSDTVSYLVLAIYLIGFALAAWKMSRSLHSIARLYKESEVIVRTNKYTLYQQIHLPTFSFFSHIFLDVNAATLSKEELSQVIEHEKVHVYQKHSVDVMLFEVATVVFWFNPVLRFLKKSIKLTHEFLVDEKVASNANVFNYSNLLVKLSTSGNVSTLVHGFSNKQLFERISMLTKPKSRPMQKLKFLYTIPVIAAVLILHACFGETRDRILPTVQIVGQDSAEIVTGELIQKITWKGNKLYSDEALTNVLGVKVGDRYNKDSFTNKLYPVSGGKDLASVYMDHGYMFFRVEEKAIKTGNGVELEIEVYEGNLVTVDKIIIKGNGTVPKQEILKEINVTSGELFNRSKIITAQRALAAIGKFDPKNINVNPYPNSQFTKVDMEFVLSENKK